MPATKAVDLAAHPLTTWQGPLGLPDFARFGDDEFAPVFDAALKAHEAEIEAIAANEDTPTIENTLQALELAGEALDHVSSIFWCRAGAHTNEDIQALERDISPRMSRHFSAISMNERLFARIDDLYRRRETLKLDAERLRVLEKTWKGFVRSGAKLDADGKKRLAGINEELSSLGTSFGQNVLADERDWALFLDEADLAGLPDFVKSSMAEAAETRGQKGRYAVTLSRSIYEPFSTFSERRDLREIAFRAFTMRGQNGGATDNTAVVRDMLKLRAEKAKLLGYGSFAALKLDDTMAKTPKAVHDLLDPVWEKALEKAADDQKELERLAAEAGSNEKFAAWDWRFYQEKLRAEKFAFDEAELKPYLQLDRIIDACFDVATRLFGITFEERKGIAAWHPDARVFVVKNADGSERGLFLADYFARPSKRSGAWMSALKSGYRLGPGASPIIYNIMNFAKPPVGEPALLSVDEAKTLFHEFGHALHGMLTDVTWPSVSGTSVSRDFVELPSQLYEHWLTVPAVLEKHALHVKTGKPMPKALLDKMLAARTFGAGFATVEFTASALIDMAFHARPDAPEEPLRFEAETLEKLDMPDTIAMRHRTPHFGHVFAGEGYSAGYYSYMWSEVLDADAFAAFEETGDPFNPALAERLRKNIYAAGGSKDPEELYTAFRGKMPSPEAMMVKRGLV
ncbi:MULTISPECIES: M3 family metallopeptidase [unclassified Mesorhizobium]|uniref:M3 family metallopeptidase n=1 Tax=unclassified Mesorhizobium TaxID=325217 RepID=UPI0011285AD1|nr:MULTISPECIES: M3 family metallopeptidase [unclassified Mesorhizobium]MBZ9999099.1 M3 family metallopeptidase [Mesorhizobium sp. B264B2A]MCA0009397.1 M3 family metallopeptidase [Mesorhizobium sp. B264B1B]MCA0021454.1 M3 family metallopeptidase [Mesorhizobium sp. B264B1A]TPJ50034.1 M3 family metallopeptidase [Mesorhizobium sp. B2-6-6]